MSKRVRDKVYRCTRIMRCAAYFHTHTKKDFYLPKMNNFFHEKSQAKFNINVLMCLTCPRTYHCPSGPCFVRGLKSAAHLIHFLLDVRDVHVPDVAANMPLPSSRLGLRLPRTSRRLPYPTIYAKKNGMLWKKVDSLWQNQCKFIPQTSLISLVFCMTLPHLHNRLHPPWH